MEVLFFDKATGLPVKAEFEIALKEVKEQALEFTFSHYKDFAGRKHFTKVEAKQDGQPVLEAELSDIRWLEKLDPPPSSGPRHREARSSRRHRSHPPKISPFHSFRSALTQVAERNGESTASRTANLSQIRTYGER
jgi:hypothetical protein